MKDIEWLKKHITIILGGKVKYKDKNVIDDKYFVGLNNAYVAVLEMLESLDVETITQGWIDEHLFRLGGKYPWQEAVPVVDLQNLLVPKQELPVIPQWVADNIESKKIAWKRLNVAMSEFPESKLMEELGIDEHECNEIYARAWLDGYTVEEEQKYYVRENNYLLCKWKNEVMDYVEAVGCEITDLVELKLTEQEIKDYDERFWPFAKPVEEVEK